MAFAKHLLLTLLCFTIACRSVTSQCDCPDSNLLNEGDPILVGDITATFACKYGYFVSRNCRII